MKRTFLFILPVLILLSCGEKTIEPNTELVDSGLLGVWEVATYSIDGVVQPNASCCEFLRFEEDAIIDDLHGLFSATRPGFNTEGSFEADFTANQIKFTFNNMLRLSTFTIIGTQLTINYTENNLDIEEVWNRNN